MVYRILIIPADQLSTAIRLRREGWNWYGIGRYLGYHWRTIKRELERVGEDTSRLPPWGKHSSRTFSLEMERKIAADASRGDRSYTALGRKYGCTRHTIRNIRKRAGRAGAAATP